MSAPRTFDEIVERSLELSMSNSLSISSKISAEITESCLSNRGDSFEDFALCRLKHSAAFEKIRGMRQFCKGEVMREIEGARVGENALDAKKLAAGLMAIRRKIDIETLRALHYVVKDRDLLF